MKHKLMSQTQDVAGDLAAAGSAGVASWTWIATANDVLQLIATAVAIVAGIYAVVWHRVRIAEVKRNNDEQSN